MPRGKAKHKRIICSFCLEPFIGHPLRRSCDSCGYRRILHNNLMSNYGMTVEEYEMLVEKQKNKCAICETSTPGKRCKRWFVDHNHQTGAIRGLLCLQCNTGIGMLADSPVVLKNALRYLWIREE